MTFEKGDEREYFSYVQLRGSIPLRWTQTPDVSFSPPIEVQESESVNIEVMKKLYQHLKQEYKECVLINLIDKKGDQKQIG